MHQYKPRDNQIRDGHRFENNFFFIIFPHFLSILIVLEVEDTYLSELFLKVKKQTKKQEDLEKTRFVVVSAVSSV